MKLRNKKTGEIKDVRMSYRIDSAPIVVSETTKDDNGQSQGWPYHSLAELNEEWEDYEEPKEHWIINSISGIETTDRDETDEPGRAMIEIGNYFETREEAEQAVEKLKAWKRLKDKGFRFKYWTYKMDEPKIENYTYFKIVGVCEDGVRLDDLDLLFGGEE